MAITTQRHEIYVPDGNGNYILINPKQIFIGICSTAAATPEKEVTCSDFTSDSLYAGVIVMVTFANTNSAAVANLKLDVNSTGEKPIKYIYNGSLSNIAGAGYLKANQMYQFYYDGTNWVVHMVYNTNTTYSALALADLNTGTATTGRLITAKVANDGIHQNADIAWDATNKKLTQLDANIAIDKLEFVAGTNIALTGDTNKLTIGVTGVVESAARLSNTSAIGSATKPVYFTADGIPAEASTYAGGTAVTLNGTSKAGSTASFYAPVAAGTKTTQTLISGGANAAPTWTDISPSVAWTAGTTAGPTLKVSALGQTSSAVAIPSASATASGIVTTDTQYFEGTKIFTNVNLYFKNYTKGTAPASQAWQTLGWYDDKGTDYITNRYAKIETTVSTANETTMAIALADPGNNTTQVERGLWMKYPAGGVPQAYFNTTYLTLFNNSNSIKGTRLDALLDANNKTYGAVRLYYNDVERATLYSNAEGGNLKLYGPNGDFIEMDHYQTIDNVQGHGLRIYSADSSGTYKKSLFWSTDSTFSFLDDGIHAQDSASTSGRVIRLSNSYGDIALHTGTSGRGIWDYTKSNWLIYRKNNEDVTRASGNFATNATGYGYWLADSSGYAYGGIHDNGSNLWIGASAGSSRHHTGGTYISAGWTGSAGNPTIYCSVPKTVSSVLNNYAMWHSGNSLTGQNFYSGNTNVAANSSATLKSISVPAGVWLITGCVWLATAGTDSNRIGAAINFAGTQVVFSRSSAKHAGGCSVSIVCQSSSNVATAISLEGGHDFGGTRTLKWTFNCFLLRTLSGGVA